MAINTLLFDFDGVVIDTEPQYSAFWHKITAEYGITTPNFDKIIKGTTLPEIFTRFLPQLTIDQHEAIRKASVELENNIQFPLIAGALNFIVSAKKRGYKVGLVTSSNETKVCRAFKILNIENLFDTVVTGESISKGKPHPMCYLLGAEKLGVDPQNCMVFEDAITGITAGTAANMPVIGLCTTYPAHAIEKLVCRVFPDFENQAEIFAEIDKH